jgi:hypothetical protein
VCVQLGRPRGARRFEGRRHTPAARSSVRSRTQPEGAACRSSEHTCGAERGEHADGRGEAAAAMYEHAVWQCIGRKCSDWPRGALGRRGALYHGLPSWPTLQVAGVKKRKPAGKMRALTVGLEHKQSAESAHPTPPSPRVRQFHLPRVVLRVLSGHGHHGHHGHPKLNLEK